MLRSTYLYNISFPSDSSSVVGISRVQACGPRNVFQCKSGLEEAVILDFNFKRLPARPALKIFETSVITN